MQVSLLCTGTPPAGMQNCRWLPFPSTHRLLARASGCPEWFKCPGTGHSGGISISAADHFLRLHHNHAFLQPGIHFHRIGSALARRGNPIDSSRSLSANQSSSLVLTPPLARQALLLQGTRYSVRTPPQISPESPSEGAYPPYSCLFILLRPPPSTLSRACHVQTICEEHDTRLDTRDALSLQARSVAPLA